MYICTKVFVFRAFSLKSALSQNPSKYLKILKYTPGVASKFGIAAKRAARSCHFQDFPGENQDMQYPDVSQP